MDEKVLSLRSLDIGRLAALRIRLITGLVFRSEGLPGRHVAGGEPHETAVNKQQAVVAALNAAAIAAQSYGAANLGQVVNEVLALFRGQIQVCIGSNAVLMKRFSIFEKLIAGFDCPHCSSGDRGETRCILEFLELISSIRPTVEEAYRHVSGNIMIAFPTILLEMAPHHAHQTTDILDLTAATGTCRVVDGRERYSIVGLGIKDHAFCWETLCQLPYVIMHELLVHAFQGLRGGERVPVDPTCAWSEGWMDGLAFKMTERWLDSGYEQMPRWVRRTRGAIKAKSVRLHERRREPQDGILPDVLSERIAAFNASNALEGYYQGECHQNDDAFNRLLRFSLRLNLHDMPQRKRNEIVDWLALALELFEGTRLDDVVGACERFVAHDNWQTLVEELVTLVGSDDELRRNQTVIANPAIRLH